MSFMSLPLPQIPGQLSLLPEEGWNVRDELADERQALWSHLAGAVTVLSAYDLRVLSTRVKQVTRKLNGHAHDLGRFEELLPHPDSGGGLYEQKRHDRLAKEVLDGTHEYFLDEHGDRRFSTSAKDPGNSYQSRLRLERELAALQETQELMGAELIFDGLGGR